MNTDELRTALAERAETVDGYRASRVDEVHRRIAAARGRRVLSGACTAARAARPKALRAAGDRPERRLPVMDMTLRIAVAAALVIAAALVGVSYLTGRDDPDPTMGGGPTSLPTSTAPIPEMGEREPGRYSVPIFGTAAIRADVSVESQDWAFDRWLLRRDGTGHIMFWTVSWVNGDPCAASPDRIDLPPGYSTDDVVDALDGQAGTDLSAPTAVVVGGYPGVRFDLTATSCIGGTIWSDSDGFLRPNGAGSNFLWVIDVAGTPVVIDVQAEVDAAIEAMIDSVTFTSSS